MHYVIGNLYQQDMDDIWQSEAAQKARDSIADGSFAFCRKMSCPFCERGDLEDLSEQEFAERAVPTETPEYINIGNDYICNIACTTCRTALYCPKEGEREKIDDALNRLIPFANKAREINLNGRGEFLANQSYINFLEELKPEREDFRIHFETNGILFDEAHWAKFAHLGEYNVGAGVTINSLRRDVYQYLSGGFDKLDRVLENLRFLSRLKRENKLNDLSVTMVVQESNFWEIPEYIRTFAHSEEYEIDNITLRPCYSWFGMKRDTYWFKNVLNPLHPYHKAYLRILEDDCWNEPKVYDWGCHNIREPLMHPASDDKMFARLLMEIYDNDKRLSPVEYVKTCLERAGIHRIGVYGENDYTNTFFKLLREAGADIAFKLTRFKDAEGDPPTISMPNLAPESVDAIVLMEFYDQQNRINNLRAIKFQGSIVNLKELIEGYKTHPCKL